jgi:glycosyltransferase involved in cell wall biosynthesis
MKNRILHFVRFKNFKGGAPIIVDLLLNNKNNTDMSVVGLYEKEYDQDFRISDNFILWDTKYLYSKYRKILPWFFFKKLSALFSFTISIRFWFFLKKRDVQLLHFHFPKYINHFVKAAKNRKIPVILTLHQEINQDLGIVKAIKKLGNYKSQITIVAVSKNILESVKKVNDELNVVLIYNGLDTNRLILNQKQKISLPTQVIDKSKVVLGCVARLNNEKGVDILIDVAKKFQDEIKDIIFLVLGDGPLMNIYKSELVKFKLDNFFLLGFHNNILDFLEFIDIYVQPSRHESFGLSVLEAMYASKLIIASDIGGIPEVLGDTGIYFQSGNVVDLQNKIKHVLNNLDTYKLLGSKATVRSLLFDKDLMIGYYNTLYSKLI